MAESEKGPVSTANIKKKSASFDEDFGKDFLSPWKTSKLGKDPIDFDVETISGNGKGFKFDKLDDFEFGGDFDKISSFKMDMSDLDFSSPLKKAEKPNEESCKDLVLGKKEPRKENFSFTFDFNELSMFGLDPKLVTSENEATKPIDGISTEGSVNHDKELISRSNSAMKTDKVESDEIQALPKKASMDSSKLTHLIEQDSVKSDDPSASSNLSCNNMCCEAQVSTEIHTLMTQENAEDKRFSEEHGKAADDSLSARPFAEKTAQHFSLISVSCDDLVRPTLAKMLTEVSTSEPGKANLGREQDNSVRSIASSQSRNSSPVNSHNSRAWQSAYKSESPITSSEFQKDEGNKKEIVRSGSRELIEHTKDLASTSDREFSDGSSHEAKNEGEKQNSNPKLLPSPLHRDLIQVKSNHRKGKGTFLLSNPLSISTEKVTRPNPALTSKQLRGVDLYSTDRNKEPKQTDEQAENKKPATQGAPDVIGTEREDLISSFQPQSSNLVGPTITSTTTKNLMPNIISNCKFMKSSRSVSSVLQGTSPKDGKQALLSSLTAFRIRKLNGNSPSSCLQQEAKPKEVLEGNKGTPTTSELTTSVIKKHALLSPPLKRKIVEAFVPEQDVLNSVTFIMKSPTKRRKSPEIATRSTSEMVLGGENLESFNPIPLNSSHEIGGLLNFEVPILVENDGNVEKAEACARELDDICSMLKKKNEEAKELLVRAVVNNNALLMLNHPMFEEKIRALQKFATSLHSKYSM